MLCSTLRLAAAIALSTAPGLAQDAPKPEAATIPPAIAAPAGNPAASEGVAPAPTTPASPAEIIIPPTPAVAPTIGIDPSRFGEKPADPAFGAYQRGQYLTAFNIALPRAKQGDPAAMTLVAEIYARGLGLAKNEKEAADWYGKAADAGVAEAQFQYALVLLDGRLAGKDEARAKKLMQAAADSGNRLAQFNLAQMILDSESGTAGQLKAVEYYMKAAEAGLPDAQYAVSQIYANGAGGISKDEPEARKWLLLSAQQNFDTAQVDLGSWLVEGKGGPRDMKAGFGWMRRAAQGGNVAGQNRLAKLYVEGLGVEPDSIEGAAWYIIARRAGLVDHYMEDFMQGLTDDETKKAIERANKLR